LRIPELRNRHVNVEHLKAISMRSPRATSQDFGIIDGTFQPNGLLQSHGMAQSSSQAEMAIPAAGNQSELEADTPKAEPDIPAGMPVMERSNSARRAASASRRRPA
jgi:hypothetical protein